MSAADGARRHHLWLLPAAWLAHRGWLILRYGEDLEALFRANPYWIVVQLQSWEALKSQAAAALWWLQQSPPVPNAVEALLLQFASWPVGAGWAHVALQALCSLAAALLLAETARRLVPARAATALGLLWILSPDVVVLETTGMGQTYYENLAVVGVLACVYAFLRWCEAFSRRRETSSRRRARVWALALGVAAGVLALTRSSYGFFSLPLVALMALLAPLLWRSSLAGSAHDGTSDGDRAPRRAVWRQVALCAVLALSIQGAWSLKNLAVFGHWTWPASTWGGSSLAASVDAVGAGDRLASDIVLEGGEYPTWFLTFVVRDGVAPWTADWWDAEQKDGFCPDAARAHDARVSERLGGENRPENTQCLRLVSEEFGAGAMRFLLRHPGVLLEKTKLAYATYWFPMRYHGGQYLSLFSVDWRVERSLRPWRSAGQLLSGELPEPVYVTSGTWPDVTRRPVRLLTPDTLATAWWLVELVVLHLVTPFVVLLSLRRLLRDRTLSSRDALVLMMAMTYVYSAGLHNLAELGENMRFRWNVEPVIWLLVVDSLARLKTSVEGLVGQRKTSR